MSQVPNIPNGPRQLFQTPGAPAQNVLSPGVQTAQPTQPSNAIMPPEIKPPAIFPGETVTPVEQQSYDFLKSSLDKNTTSIDLLKDPTIQKVLQSLPENDRYAWMSNYSQALNQTPSPRLGGYPAEVDMSPRTTPTGLDAIINASAGTWLTNEMWMGVKRLYSQSGETSKVDTNQYFGEREKDFKSTDAGRDIWYNHFLQGEYNNMGPQELATAVANDRARYEYRKTLAGAQGFGEGLAQIAVGLVDPLPLAVAAATGGIGGAALKVASPFIKTELGFLAYGLTREATLAGAYPNSDRNLQDVTFALAGDLVTGAAMYGVFGLLPRALGLVKKAGTIEPQQPTSGDFVPDKVTKPLYGSKKVNIEYVVNPPDITGPVPDAVAPQNAVPKASPVDISKAPTLKDKMPNIDVNKIDVTKLDLRGLSRAEAEHYVGRPLTDAEYYHGLTPEEIAALKAPLPSEVKKVATPNGDTPPIVNEEGRSFGFVPRERAELKTRIDNELPWWQENHPDLEGHSIIGNEENPPVSSHRYLARRSIEIKDAMFKKDPTLLSVGDVPTKVENTIKYARKSALDEYNAGKDKLFETARPLGLRDIDLHMAATEALMEHFDNMFEVAKAGGPPVTPESQGVIEFAHETNPETGDISIKFPAFHVEHLTPDTISLAKEMENIKLITGEVPPVNENISGPNITDFQAAIKAAAPKIRQGRSVTSIVKEAAEGIIQHRIFRPDSDFMNSPFSNWLKKILGKEKGQHVNPDGKIEEGTGRPLTNEELGKAYAKNAVNIAEFGFKGIGTLALLGYGEYKLLQGIIYGANAGLIPLAQREQVQHLISHYESPEMTNAVANTLNKFEKSPEIDAHLKLLQDSKTITRDFIARWNLDGVDLIKKALIKEELKKMNLDQATNVVRFAASNHMEPMLPLFSDLGDFLHSYSQDNESFKAALKPYPDVIRSILSSTTKMETVDLQDSLKGFVENVARALPQTAATWGKITDRIITPIASVNSREVSGLDGGGVGFVTDVIVTTIGNALADMIQNVVDNKSVAYNKTWLEDAIDNPITNYVIGSRILAKGLDTINPDNAGIMERPYYVPENGTDAIKFAGLEAELASRKNELTLSDKHAIWATIPLEESLGMQRFGTALRKRFFA
jgi:hypothetical protein